MPGAGLMHETQLAICHAIDEQLTQVPSFTYGTEPAWLTPLAWSLVTNTEAVLHIMESVTPGGASAT